MSPLVAEPRRFRHVVGPALHEPRLLRVTSPVGVGDAVIAPDGSKHRLARALGAGGEGTVYETDTGLACKVYEPARLTVAVRQKLERMSTVRPTQPAICWPLAPAANRLGELIGYLMPRAAGVPLQRAIFVKPLFEATFPRWTRLELVRLASSILDAIAAVHDVGALLGDINPSNILVRDEHTVFLVDTDSYQVEDFACPVGTATFLPPELLGVDLGTILRTPEQELFAVATLLFMILVPGKPPFSHAGGGDPAENVRARHFPYALADKRGQSVPAGPWRYVWSHLPFYLKRAFHDAFVDGARPSVGAWQELLARYRYDLERERLTLECFPTTFKAVSREIIVEQGGTWRRCADCGAEFGSFEGAPCCRECRARPVRVVCGLCDRTFEARPVWVEKLAGRPPICEGCRRLTRTVQCRTCGLAFELSPAAQAGFKSKGLQLPKRCKACRQRGRA